MCGYERYIRPYEWYGSCTSSGVCCRGVSLLFSWQVLGIDQTGLTFGTASATEKDSTYRVNPAFSSWKIHANYLEQWLLRQIPDVDIQGRLTHVPKGSFLRRVFALFRALFRRDPTVVERVCIAERLEGDESSDNSVLHWIIFSMLDTDLFESINADTSATELAQQLYR